MKIQYPQPMLFPVMLAVFFIECACLCLGADLEPALGLGRKMSQLEDTWRTGSTREYYAQAEGIMKDITVNSTTGNLSNVATKLFENLLSKEAEAKDVGVTDISVMKELALFLITSGDKVSLDERQVNVGLLSVFLGKIRKEQVTNYKPKPVVANVPPPAGVPGMAGMSPDAIKDAGAKAKYEAAIKENRENNISNARQIALVQIDKEVRGSIIGYMIKTFRSGVSSPDLVDRCIRDAMLNDAEKAEVLEGKGAAPTKQ